MMNRRMRQNLRYIGQAAVLAVVMVTIYNVFILAGDEPVDTKLNKRTVKTIQKAAQQTIKPPSQAEIVKPPVQDNVRIKSPVLDAELVKPPGPDAGSQQQTRLKKRAKQPDDKPDNQVRVIIAAFARGGSTFTGELFRRFGNSMFWYEPDIYRDLYMNKVDLMMPNWVTRFKNGSHRVMPEWEEKMYVDTTIKMLRCRINELPVMMMTHPTGVFNSRGKFSSYSEKVNLKETWDESLKCYKPLFARYLRLCNWKKNWMLPENTCVDYKNSQLYKMWRKTDHRPDFNYTEYEEISRGVVRCMEPIESRVRSHTHRVQDLCVHSEINVIKYVRVRVKPLLTILETDKSVKAIILSRDPRAITASRKTTFGMKIFYDDVVEHTKALCDDVLEDYQLWQKVKDKYRARVLYVKYEDMTQNQTATLQQYFKLLGLQPSVTVQNWIRAQTNCAKEAHSRNTCRNIKDAKVFNAKWKKEITREEGLEIEKHPSCIKVFQLLNYDKYDDTPDP